MEQSQYEIDKQKKKQQLVRNEFLYHGNSNGKYEFPVIKKQDIDISKIKFISYADTKNGDVENKYKTVHFFTYDWVFENVYKKADEQLKKLSEYYALLSPDFSLFTNMPLALQIESVFKNRWCGAYWQSKGLTVIPTISWGDEKSFDFCFDGIEKGSVVAVSTYYRENCEEDFMLGYNEMIKRINPSVVICYDEPFKSMTGNVVEFLPTTYEWTNNLSKEDLIRFKWEKRHRNVSGLNKKDFKFFDYNDPLEKNTIVKCSVCGKAALQDEWGNGECRSCGWKFSKDEDVLEKNSGISYPMLVPVSRAREQYKAKMPFKATFEDFINGLKFYSEMLFEYNNEIYEVFFKGDKVCFCNERCQQIYSTVDEFYKKANIDGVPLKDMWDKVKKPSFMYCG